MWLGGTLFLLAAQGATAAALTNLVANGAFEDPAAGDPRRPAGWALPDGVGVRWEAGTEGTDGRAIWMNTRISESQMVASWRACGLTNLWDIPNPAGNAIADTYGLSYYSDAFPIVSGQVYRVRCQVYGAGGSKVWVRGYGPFRGRRVKRYEALMNCTGRADAWTSNEMVFHPTEKRPEVDELRVMLYAYDPPRRYGFDEVVVEPIERDTAPPVPAREGP